MDAAPALVAEAEQDMNMRAFEYFTTGLHPTMPAPEYHGIRAMSASGLRLMARSPAHYYGAMLDPARPAQEPTPAMRAGTLFHTALFEGDKLASRYNIKPKGLDARTKCGKEWLASVPAGFEVIDADQWDTAKAQVASILTLPDISALLSDGRPEVSAFWRDTETQASCKCRPDWVSQAGDGVILVDGKTTIDASPDGFGRSIWKYRYDLQAAWYSDGYTAATGSQVHGFVFAVVESTWPYVAASYMLGDDALDKARADIKFLMFTYAECQRTGIWPAFGKSIQRIGLPRWARYTDQEIAA